MNKDKANWALTLLVETIHATGGVYEDGSGLLVPVGDPEWGDLADAYMAACKALDIEPMIEEKP